MDLKTNIAGWDGKSAAYIKSCFDKHNKQADFINTLLNLMREATYQKGASWLLKAWLEEGNPLNNGQADELLNLINLLEHWEARLHILQILPYVQIQPQNKQTLAVFLKTQLNDTNTFVRTWAYNGFYVLSTQYAEYRQETQQLFDEAMTSEKASVKARIRNLIKAGFNAD